MYHLNSVPRYLIGKLPIETTNVMHLKSLIYPISLGLTDLQWLCHMWDGVVVRDAPFPVMTGHPVRLGSSPSEVSSRTGLVHT